MKENVTTRSLWVVGVVLFWLAVTSQANTEPFEQRTPLTDLASSVKTPEAIARFMWRHFNFETDQSHFGREDYWQSPEELFRTGRGDCEDFALFARELLSRNGIPSFLLGVYGNGRGHTVCVFKEKGKYQAIDGVRLVRYRSSNLQQLSSEIYPFWEKAAIVSYSSTTHQGKILKEFEKGS